MKNVLPESMQPYGLVRYNGRWYITFDEKGTSIHVYKTKAEALFVVEQLYNDYKKFYPNK